MKDLAWECCTHCGCSDIYGHDEPCDLGCNEEITVLNDGGVTVAQIETYTEALADRDRARTVAVALEQRLDVAERAVRDLTDGHGLPRDNELGPGGFETRWDLRCRICRQPHPCPSCVARERVLG